MAALVGVSCNDLSWSAMCDSLAIYKLYLLANFATDFHLLTIVHVCNYMSHVFLML